MNDSLEPTSSVLTSGWWVDRVLRAALVVALSSTAAACGTGAATSDGASTSRPSSAQETAADSTGDHPEAPDGTEEVADPQPRLVVGDGEAGTVTLLDLVTGEPLDTYEVAEPPYLSTSPEGRLAYLVAHESDEVDVLATGAWSVDHGDHDHHFVEDAGLLEPVTGPAPSHVVANDEATAVFTDGDGSVTLLDEDALAEGEATGETIATGRPHHGVAVAVDDGVVVTLPDPALPEGELPHGVTVRDEAGQVVAESSGCPELHGEVTTGAGLAFACADGVLVVEPDGAESTFRTVAYPADATGLRAWSLVGDERSDVVFGALAGEDTSRAIARIDLTAGTATQVPLPAEASAVALDPANDVVLVVTSEGRVHAVDATTGEVRASVPVVGTSDPAAEVPHPQIAVGDDRAYVSDPAAGTVVEVATNDDLRVTRTFDLGGAPQRLVVAGAR